MKKFTLLLFSMIGLGAYSQTNNMCLNLDPCNLVCNPHMEDLANDCTSETSACFYYFNIGCPGSGDGITSWNRMFGGPVWFDAFTSCVPPTYYMNTYNYNHLPGDPGGEIAVRNVLGENPNTTSHSNSFMTNVNVDANKRYLLSFYRTNWSNYASSASPGYDVRLTDNSEITWNTSGNTGGPLISNFQIVGEGTIAGVNWSQVVSCFTTDNNPNYDVLYFESRLGTGNTVKGVKFDHVELIEDKLHETPESYTVNCLVPSEIGIELCEIDNLEYQWWDVTGFPTQLTAGSNVVAPGSLDYMIAVSNGSGSIIEVSGIEEDIELELRRVIPSVGQYGIPVIGACNDFVELSIIADCEVAIDCDPDNWPKGYGGSSSGSKEVANTLVADQDGNVYVRGYVESGVQFDNGTMILGNSFLAKYDNCGSLLWVQDISIYGNDDIQNSELKIDNAGNVLFLSAEGNTLSQNNKHHLTKFDGNGNLIWSNVIEQWGVLPLPSFDIDQNTNDIYLVASVGSYLRIKDQSNNYVVNYTFPSSTVYPKNGAYIVKYNPSGYQIWQDRLVANGGMGQFEDVVVAESTGNVFVVGYTQHYSFSNTNIYLNSNPSVNLTPLQDKRLFMAAYSTSGAVNWFQLYENIAGYPTTNKVEYSNANDELYLTSYKYKFSVFNQVGSLLGSTTLNFYPQSIQYNQNEGYLLISGYSGSGAYRPHLRKYQGLNQIWSYTVGSLSRGIIYDAYPDPISNKIFISGSYFDNPLVFSPTSSLPVFGGRDAFISRVRDQGASVQYLDMQTDNLIESGFESISSAIEGLSTSNVLIYPNPTNDIVYVRFSDSEIIDGTLELFNSVGVLIEKRANLMGNATIRFDLNDLPVGIYLIKYYDANGHAEVKKVIKQN